VRDKIPSENLQPKAATDDQCEINAAAMMLNTRKTEEANSKEKELQVDNNPPNP